jgi:hypothetical protein
MGGFGTALAGALEGVGDALHKEHVEQFNTETEHRKALLKQYGEMAVNPNVPPDVQQEAMRRWGVITQVPYNKKLPSDVYKPFERTQPQPQQAQPPQAPSGLAPQAPASPGPAASTSAGGGPAPGTLQGQANQLPPVTPAAAPPPAPSGNQAAPPPPSGNTYTPQEVTGFDAARTGAVTEAQTKAQLQGRYEAFLAMGLSPEEARQRATMTPGMMAWMRPGRANVLTAEGKTIAATRQFDPATGVNRYMDVSGNDITESVVREIGTGTTTLPVMKIVKGGVQMPDGRVIPASSKDMPPEAKQLWDSHVAEMTRSVTKGSVTDEFGNTFSRSTATIGSAAPPAPPGGRTAKPAGASGRGSGVGAPRTKFEVERTDRSYQQISSQIEKTVKPIEDLYARFGRLQDSVNQNTPQADALVGPELLTVMAGGSGSGLRMSEAEISRIVGGRSNWESLKAAVNKWKLDPTQAVSITPEQRREIRQLMDTVGMRLRLKQNIISQSRDALLNGQSPAEHRKVYADLKRILAGIDQGQVILQSPDGNKKPVPLEQVEHFMQMGATVVPQ